MKPPIDAENLAYALRNVTAGDLELMPAMALRAFRHVLRRPDPSLNSDVAEIMRKQLLWDVERILGH